MIVLLYLGAVVWSNWSAARFGAWITLFNAFAMIGFVMVARDRLHDALAGRRWLLGVLIAAGGALSYLINAGAGRIALASVVAFTASEVVDTLVYQGLHRQRWAVRSNLSNVPSSIVDSILFPTIAFGGFSLWLTVGQALLKIAGGGVWVWVIAWVSSRAASRAAGRAAKAL